MPEADFEFRQVLKSAQLLHQQNELRLHVILKGNRDAEDRYRQFFGLSNEKISRDGLSDWVSDGFDQWSALVE
jgi:hypothetical protein